MSSFLRVTSLIVFAAGSIATAAPAAAQTGRGVGLTVGYPGRVGVLVDVTDRIAVRPEFDLSGTSNDLSSGRTISVGVSVLFYQPAVDDVRAYVSPRFRFGHQSAGSNDDPDLESDNSVTSISGSIGAEYSPTNRFGVYGEVGFGYDRSSNENPFSGEQFTSHSWGLRSGVGVVIRF